ncbi:methyltransferase domain-containing protein [Candidatus Woesearchaeota archaeon]|nr:methyltransferase domain-containing protein [Candidatus Woesearchaeota archaeon]
MKIRAEATNIEIQEEEWENKYSVEDYFREGYSSLAELVEKIIKELIGKRILELGCGQGQDAIYFGKKGAVITALDFSQRATNSTKTKIKKFGLEKTVSVMKADISSDISSDPVLPKESFDIVFANLRLHYFDNKTTKRIFSDIYRLLVPGGYLFFEVKSTADLDYRKGEEIEKDFFNHNGKKRHFFSEAYLLECTERYNIICVQPKQYMSEGKLSSFLSACVKKPYLTK